MMTQGVKVQLAEVQVVITKKVKRMEAEGCVRRVEEDCLVEMMIAEGVNVNLTLWQGW
jgi:hypothetical protein